MFARKMSNAGQHPALRGRETPSRGEGRALTGLLRTPVKDANLGAA